MHDAGHVRALIDEARQSACNQFGHQQTVRPGWQGSCVDPFNLPVAGLDARYQLSKPSGNLRVDPRQFLRELVRRPWPGRKQSVAGSSPPLLSSPGAVGSTSVPPSAVGRGGTWHPPCRAERLQHRSRIARDRGRAHMRDPHPHSMISTAFGPRPWLEV